MYYILDEDKNVVKVDNIRDWSSMFENSKRTVKKTFGTFEHEGISQRIMVSTVFLGLDHGLGGVPKVFETMAFRVNDVDEVSDWSELICERYSSWEEASVCHDEIVLRLELLDKVEERGG